jgi:hypothetical protein
MSSPPHLQDMFFAWCLLQRHIMLRCALLPLIYHRCAVTLLRALMLDTAGRV